MTDVTKTIEEFCDDQQESYEQWLNQKLVREGLSPRKTRKELQEEILRLSGRLCVSCGRYFPKEQSKNSTPDDCQSREACLLDLTTEEAFLFWKQKAHEYKAQASFYKDLIKTFSQDKEKTDTQSIISSVYIGDGVYLSFDGYQLWLAVNHHMNNVVALEPQVFNELKKQGDILFGYKEAEGRK